MRLKGEYAQRLLGKCCLDPNLLPLDSIVSEGGQSQDQIYLSTNWLTKSLQIDRAVSWKESGSSKPLFWRQDLTYFNSTLPVMSYITFSFFVKAN